VVHDWLIRDAIGFFGKKYAEHPPSQYFFKQTQSGTGSVFILVFVLAVRTLNEPIPIRIVYRYTIGIGIGSMVRTGLTRSL
jgi:hypothetical protein